MISVVRGKGSGGLLTLEVHSPKNLYEVGCLGRHLVGPLDLEELLVKCVYPSGKSGCC